MDRGDDNVGRFMAAIIDSAQFRDEIASGEANRIGFALSIIGVKLDPTHQDNLVDACAAMTNANAWNFMDNIRTALTETPASTVG
jgi:hypothetical protein